MSREEINKQDLLNRIEVLLAESYRLPHARKTWERRTEIDWEILLLCRKMAELANGDAPYWADPTSGERSGVRHSDRSPIHAGHEEKGVSSRKQDAP